MNKTIEALSKSLELLDKNIGRKLDLVNKSNTELSLQVIPDMSQRITALGIRGTHSQIPARFPKLRQITLFQQLKAYTRKYLYFKESLSADFMILRVKDYTFTLNYVPHNSTSDD